MKMESIATLFDKVSLQLAAESFLADKTSNTEITEALTEGNLVLSKTPEDVGKREFYNEAGAVERFRVVAHMDLSLAGHNRQLEASKSGFSGTLFEDTQSGSYTISFRSTEFSDPITDHGDVYADLQIGLQGWAFNQMYDMEVFWSFLSALTPGEAPAGVTVTDPSAIAGFRDHLAGGGSVDVTGYSLGANLAQAFSTLHSDVVDNTYFFNGAGTGHAGDGLKSLWNKYLDTFNQYTPSWVDYGPGIAEISFGVAWPLISRIPALNALLNASWTNPRHRAASRAIAPDTTGALLYEHRLPDAATFDVWAANSPREHPLDTIVAELGVRHGHPVRTWHEKQPAAYWASFNPLDNYDAAWGTGHSIVLLQDSLGVMALYEGIAPAVTMEALGSWFEASSFNHYDSLERAVNALALLTGVDPIDLTAAQAANIDFAEIAFRNLLHSKIYEIKDAGLFDTLAALDAEDAATFQSIDITTLTEQARGDFSTFLAMHTTSPFRLTHDNIDALYQQHGLHTELHAAWQRDAQMSAEERRRGKANFSEEFYSDRQFFLLNFFSLAEINREFGEFLEPIKFVDLTSQLALDGDGRGYPNESDFNPLPGPAYYDDQRARLSFGTQGSDITAPGTGLQVSSNDDTVYAMGGNDLLDGLDGDDYLDGGDGNDDIRGNTGSDTLLGGNGNDFLYGGEGLDVMVGGRGDDQFHWSSGDDIAVIFDDDDGGDRIFVNGINLAELDFDQLSPSSTLYVDTDHPDVIASWDGTDFIIHAGSASSGGRIEVQQFAPTSGANFGITLAEFEQQQLQETDVTVTAVGRAAEQTDWEASWRGGSNQGGIDWTNSTVNLDMRNTPNFQGNDQSPVFGSVRFEGGPLEDQLTGDALNQSLAGLGGDDRIDGLQGDDMLQGWQGSDTLYGGPGNDYLFGNVSHEFTTTLTPGDFLYAFSQEQELDINTLDGGSGRDLISGGEVTDIASGGTGDDYLWGGAGGDNLYGGEGADVILGDSALGFDYELVNGQVHAQARTAFAMPAQEHTSYDDIIQGGDGNDFLWGELGADQLYGGDGADYLVGDREASVAFDNTPLVPFDLTSALLDDIYHGDDALYGGAGNDFLYGLGGNDQLAGGAGDDQLVGGAGDDVYVYTPGDGNDTIIDTEGQHTVVFQGVPADSIVASFQANQVHIGLRNAPDGEGFTLARQEWHNVTVAINAASNAVALGRLQQNYFNTSGTLVMSVAGTRGISDTDRDKLVGLDDADRDHPTFSLGNDAESVEVIAHYYGPDAHLFRISASEHFSMGYDAPSAVNIEQRIASGDWVNFDWLTSANVRARIVGFSNITCGNLDDHVIGTDGADELYGLGGSDVLEGLDGNDALYGGTGANVLIGGKGDDYLAGGTSAHYEFSAGDGHDQLDTPLSAHLRFNGVDAQGIRLIYSGDQDTTFAITTGSGNTISATGATNIRVLSSLTVDGDTVPILQESSLVNGTFFSSRLDDVFVVGAGHDVIHADAWGNDIYRFARGDGANTIIENSPLSREYLGEITFDAGIAPEEVRFHFDPLTNDAWIRYGNDEIHLDGGLYPNWRNPLALFSLTFDSSPGAAMIIQTADDDDSPWLYGSYGTDHIISGNKAHTIRPGYGNDLIEAGGGNDTIILSDHYMHEPSDQGRGIGSKRIIAGAGDDTLIAPLHQGLTFVYAVGDGHDTIEYDWSYDQPEDRYAYLLNRDLQTQTVGYTPRGQDVLELGPGLAIAELAFTRINDDLEIYAASSNGSLLIRNFFVAYQVDASGVSTTDLFADEGFVAGALTHPAVLALMPDLPISTIVLANGQAVSLQTVLDAHLVTLDVPGGLTQLGTVQDDVLYVETDSAGVIVSRQGNDTITVNTGSNYIDAGAGDDQVILNGGNNTVISGTGNDVITLNAGASHVDAGDGFDQIIVQGGEHSINAGKHFNSIQLHAGQNRVILGEGSDGIFVTGGTHTVAGYDGNGGLTSISVAQGSGASVVLEMAPGVLPLDVAVSQFAADNGYYLMVEVIGGSAAQPLNAFLFDPSDPQLTPLAGLALGAITFSDGTHWSQQDLLALAAANALVPIDGTAADDTLTGGTGRDLISGGQGDDILYGDAGNDVINGDEGNDLIQGGPGNDTLLGGAGNDTLIYHGADTGFDDIDGGEGFDRLLGGALNDVFGISNLIAGGSIEQIDGGGGHFNVISGNTADNELDFSQTELVNILAITGAEGNDRITGTQQGDILVGAAGNDWLHGGSGNDLLIGDAGDDTFAVTGVGSGVDLIRAGSGFDTLVGSDANDVFGLASLSVQDSLERIDGGSGVFDVIIGDSDANILDFSQTELVNILAVAAGDGDDRIVGSDGDDFLLGDAGDDHLTGGAGADQLRGGSGNDLFVFAGTSNGYDHISGGPGYDAIMGSASNDLIGLSQFSASDSIEVIDGGEGVFDVIGGDSHNNVLDFSLTELKNVLAITGGAGDDTIVGSAGGEIILGDSGNDHLRGGKAGDILIGGSGSDDYWFAAGDGADVLQNSDDDLASVDRAIFEDAAVDQLWFSRVQNHLVINVIGSNDQLTLDNWYGDAAARIDAFYAGEQVMLGDRVDQLVNAMAVFDIPAGIDALLPTDTRLQLEPVLASVWQAA